MTGDAASRARRRRQTEQDAETINSENSQTETSETQRLFDRCKTRRISKSSLTNNNNNKNGGGSNESAAAAAAANGDEHSPLLSASNSTHRMDERSTGATNSPALEAKVNLTGNLFEYYLPKHGDEEDWSGANGALNQGFKRKNILQYPLAGQNGGETNGCKDDEHQGHNQPPQQPKHHPGHHHHYQQQQNGHNKSTGMLTFHRSSLDASADNFSLLTPSSSTSTTPINALVKSSSIGDTTSADQCSSSLSSGSSNPSSSDSKVSPVNLYANQHLYANTGPNALSSFGYGTVNHNHSHNHNQNSHNGRVVNGKDTIVVSKAKDNTTNTKAIDSSKQQPQQQPQLQGNAAEQTNGKPTLSSTQTTFV